MPVDFTTDSTGSTILPPRRKRCFRWNHRWEHGEPFLFITTSEVLRECTKCGKRERLVYQYGELMIKEEV